MIVAVARKELKVVTRDGRFRVLALLCVLLIGVAALAGFQVTLGQARDIAAAGELERQNFDQQGAKNPHAAAHFGQYAFRPVLLPAAIDPGVSAYMGSMVWLEAHRMNLPEFRPAEDAAGVGRSARLSVAWVLQTVMPLLVIVMTFAAVAGERERGTLALLASQGLSMPRLLLGKILAALGALLLVTLPPLVICVALIAWSVPVIGSQGDAGRLGWMMLAYMLYLVTFAGLSLWVSTLARSRRTAFFMLVTVWLCITILIPRLAADLAVSRHPTPAPSEFWDAIKRAEGAPQGTAAAQGARIGALREQLLKSQLEKYGVERAEDLPVNFTAVFLQALEEADAPVFDFNFGRLWDIYESQRRVQQLAALLSPALAVRSLSAAMAGADPFAQRHFSMAAEQHRRELVAELNGIMAVEGAGARFYVAPADKWTSVDQFHYEPPATGQVLSRHLTDLGVLFGWALLPLGFGLLASRKARILA